MRNKIKIITAFVLIAIFAIIGCAATDYQTVTQKRINASFAKAEKFYNLGMYANAALAFEKVVRLAVVDQDTDLMTRAQFKYALSLERCFADPELVQTAWGTALNFARTYGIMTPEITLGWLNCRISFSTPAQTREIDQAMARFEKDFPQTIVLQKLQRLNLSAKWYMVQGLPDKAWDALESARTLMDKQIPENRELAQVFSLTLHNRAMLLVGQKDFENAMALFNRSLALDRKTNNISGIYANLSAQAKLLDAIDETTRAATVREQLLQIKRYMSNLSN